MFTTWVRSSMSIPRAAMSVATSTRVLPFLKLVSAAWRAFCDLFPWIASAGIPRRSKSLETRSAPCLVRVKTKTDFISSRSLSRWARRSRLELVSTKNACCMMVSAVLETGSTETRTGSIRRSSLKRSTSKGMVALKNIVWRLRGSLAITLRTSLIKPMSSMRSASSSTNQERSRRST